MMQLYYLRDPNNLQTNKQFFEEPQDTLQVYLEM